MISARESREGSFLGKAGRVLCTFPAELTAKPQPTLTMNKLNLFSLLLRHLFRPTSQKLITNAFSSKHGKLVILALGLVGALHYLTSVVDVQVRIGLKVHPQPNSSEAELPTKLH